MRSDHIVHKLLICFSCAALVLTMLLTSGLVPPIMPTVDTAADQGGSNITVVIDAGHGGEDGGAVSKSGIVEKGINLKVSLMLAAILRAEGVNVIMTREDDRMLYDRNTQFKGRKKSLDLAARLSIAESTENCIFVSIHMNSYPLVPDCRGIQVWYSPNSPKSQILAENVQNAAAELLQPDNTRRIKAAGSNIYILHKTEKPAILCECGFLSNPEEAERLSCEDYQRKLALTLFCGISGYLSDSTDG